MRVNLILVVLASLALLSGCAHQGHHPNDPFEPVNRKIHQFNTAFDATILKPPAKLYKVILPPQVRAGINNMYNNVNMLPTLANDILQWQWNDVIKDSWRFAINSTFGVAGIFDVATTFGLGPHSNDLGLTFAKWGNKQSPYIVIPFLGPSTIRDGMGMMFDYAFFTPYPYIPSDAVLYSILGLRYVDLRSQMLDNDRLIAEALDDYTFIRDAYLQHRHYLIDGETPSDSGALYVEEDEHDILPEEPANGTPSEFPLTTAQHATHSPARA